SLQLALDQHRQGVVLQQGDFGRGGAGTAVSHARFLIVDERLSTIFYRCIRCLAPLAAARPGCELAPRRPLDTWVASRQRLRGDEEKVTSACAGVATNRAWPADSGTRGGDAAPIRRSIARLFCEVEHRREQGMLFGR